MECKIKQDIHSSPSLLVEALHLNQTDVDNLMLLVLLPQQYSFKNTNYLKYKMNNAKFIMQQVDGAVTALLL